MKSSLARRQERLTLTSPPTRILAEVKNGREARINTNAPCFSPYRSSNPMDEVSVPRSSQSDRVREHALLETSNAVQALTHMHERDLEPRFLEIEGLELVDLGSVQGVPVMYPPRPVSEGAGGRASS